MMDGLVVARVLHLLGVVFWVGGMTLVTVVLLPVARANRDPRAGADLFKSVEHRFAGQVRWAVLLTGLSGFYMVEGFGLWERYADPGYGWMHAMFLIWLLFTLVLFVVEPLILKRRLPGALVRDPARILQLAHRLHVGLLAATLATVAWAVVGVHGG